MPHERDIYRKSLARWGEDAQFQQAIEECAELIVTLQHFARGRVGRQTVIDELADVSLMVGQLAYMFGEAELEAAIDKKIAKLERLLAEE